MSDRRPRGSSERIALLAWLERRRAGLCLLLDFDGTISDLVPRPRDAWLREDARRAIERLVARRVPTAIVSGRALHDLAARCPIAGVWLAGSHGAELETPDGTRERLVEGHAARPAIEEFLAHARLVLGPDAVIDDKGLAAAAHLPRACRPEELVRATRSLELRAARLARAGSVEALSGKAVIEVRARGASKAVAARTLLAHWPRRASPLAIGDDVTDEDMFRAVEAAGGASVKVGPGPTFARFRVADPEAVGALLEALAASPAAC